MAGSHMLKILTITTTAYSGVSLDEAVDASIRLAVEHKATVEFEFNGVIHTVRCDELMKCITKGDE